jgi:hypothetical protein
VGGLLGDGHALIGVSRQQAADLPAGPGTLLQWIAADLAAPAGAVEHIAREAPAALDGSWTVRIGHAPNRCPGAAAGQSLIGHEAVHESEREGCRLWKEAFDAGKAVCSDIDVVCCRAVAGP